MTAVVLTKRIPLVSVFVLCLLVAVSQVSGIFFYLEPGQKQYFVEHLAKHTVFLGNYTALVYNDISQTYLHDPSVNTQITVEAGREVLMNQIASPSGRFFFTSADSQEHLITIGTLQDSWYGKRVKINLEVFIGDPGETNITPPVKAHLDGMARTVSQLNTIIADIRHNQYQHRQRQIEFREQSEKVNSNVMWWMLMQLIVLAATCLWQLKHL
jgi:p24 family protein alpha